MTPSTAPFIIYALPRSRTAWISAFLTYGEWMCFHDRAIYMRSMADISTFFAQPNVGTVESGVMQGWWLIHYHVPGIRAAVILRSPKAAFDSMMAVDVAGVARFDEAKLWRLMTYGHRMLEQIARQPGVLRLDFADLDTSEGCQRLFTHCLPYEWDEAWWREISTRNIQIDVKAFLTEYFSMRDEVEGFKKVCQAELRRLCRSGVILRRDQWRA